MTIFKKHHKATVAIIVIVIVAIICALAYFFLSLIDFHFYFGWKDVKLSNTISIKVPNDWNENKENGLIYFSKDTSNDKNNTLVKDQVPKPGISLQKSSTIMLYDQDTRTSTTVPDLTGKSKYQATSELKNANLNISVEGTGTVVSQDPPKGSSVDAGTVVKVTLKQL